ncbi:hypothetical protein SELMODRAFT_413823 [Selaginella moellendorffii]|uniref:Uncharacterized protein n=1 Tax=Selaginella moellendorffii TaxID=88036 RepID=D8RQB7_SELML|nr:hypothetical protein SELMODRAFT_413823 [Selaginella moellendorffii]
MGELDAALQEAVADYDRGDKGPFLVAQEVPWQTYDEWMCCLECCWRLGYKAGDVWMYGDPSLVHRTISNWFNATIITQIQLMPEVECAIDVISAAGASRLETVQGDKEPDLCYFSASRLEPVRAVIEVAYRNEGLEALKSSVDMWEASGSRLAIGVKITRELDLTFVAKERGAAALTEIKFGPEFLDESNKEAFVMEFPLSCFTGDVEGDHRIRFDLFGLQQYVIKMIEWERLAKEMEMPVKKE